MDIENLLSRPLLAVPTEILSKVTNTTNTQEIVSKKTVCSPGTAQWATRIKKRRRNPSKKQKQREADNSRILNLTLDVNNLRQQVYNCLVQKSLQQTQLLLACEQLQTHCLLSIQRFFKLFRHGYPAFMSMEDQRFLEVLLDENMAVGGGVTGRPEFMEQWRRYKEFFRVKRLTNFSVQIVSSDSEGCSIQCSGQFEGFVTTAALQAVFPHVKEDDDLVDGILHQPFVCPTRTLINFDASGRLVSYDAFADVFNAMNALLNSNPMRVVRLMSNAMIEDGSLLPPVDDCRGNDENDYCSRSDTDDENRSVTSTTSSKSSIDFILS